MRTGIQRHRLCGKEAIAHNGTVAEMPAATARFAAVSLIAPSRPALAGPEHAADMVARCLLDSWRYLDG
jgi:hypothetical protein